MLLLASGKRVILVYFNLPQLTTISFKISRHAMFEQSYLSVE